MQQLCCKSIWMLEHLSEVFLSYHLNIWCVFYCQSHISETLEEVKLVKELFPESESYADVYYKHNLLTDKVSTPLPAHGQTFLHKTLSKYLQPLTLLMMGWFTDSDGPWVPPQWWRVGSVQRHWSLFVPLSQFQLFVSTLWFLEPYLTKCHETRSMKFYITNTVWLSSLSLSLTVYPGCAVEC